MDVQFIGAQVYKNDLQKLAQAPWHTIPSGYQSNYKILENAWFYKILEDELGKLHLVLNIKISDNKLWSVTFKKQFEVFQKVFDSTQLNDFTNADEAKQKVNDFLLKIDKLKVFL